VISIHLRRAGAKKDPHYRVVVTDSRAARDGAFIEILGHYHPRYEPAKVVLDVEKTKAWIDKGAQPSDTVKSLLRKMETGAVDVEHAVSPSRQRAAAEQAASRTAAPQPEAKAEAKSDEEAGEVETAAGEEPVEAAQEQGAADSEETAEESEEAKE
jgi:small subunit ribosomal protein S16